MNLEQIDLKETGCFSSLFLDYINQRPELKPFYSLFPHLNNFDKAIQSRAFSKSKREVLHKSLINQYNDSCSYNKVKENIDLLLLENTFTITTGHQLNIFTGPLYFIYKIVTVLRSCEELKKSYPNYNFVPVYWMASEDHDFAEINHFHLYGKKMEWVEETKGAVGRLSPKKMLEGLTDTDFIPQKFKQYYKDSNSLAEATRQLVNSLFGKDGLIVLDPDNHELKGLFKETIKRELTERKSFDLVSQTTQQLEKLEYKTQISPREINLFYLEDGLRERLEWSGNNFKVTNSTVSFTEQEILKVVEESPEKFSPNVVLRPLYQEEILPNLAYIGGPAEVIYWLQLKDVFESYGVYFPILMPRNFALVIGKQHVKKFQKLNIPSHKLFLDEYALKTYFIDKNSNNDYHLNKEVGDVEMIFSGIKEKAIQIDKSLKDYVGAELHKVQTIIAGVEKKLKKAEEKNQQIGLAQLFALKAKLFPEGNLQERHDNFLNFYISDEQFIQKVKDLLNPFEYKFNVLIENEEG